MSALRKPYRPRIDVMGAARAWEGAHVYVGTEENDLVRLQTEWGGRYLGVQSYSLLTGYAFFAVPQRLAGILDLGRQVDRLATTLPFTWNERERIHMIHWLAVSQVCMLIEELAALSTAIGAWRTTGADIANSYLRWRGDIAEALQDPPLGASPDWALLTNYVGHESLEGLGMTKSEAAAFSRAIDTTFALATEGLGWARAFFTTEMRRIYARFKHGFSLLSPLSTPLYIDTEFASRAAHQRMLESLVVMDAPQGRPRLLAMRSTGYDFGGVLQAAARISGVNSFLAISLVSEARSVVHRSVALGTLETVGDRAEPLPDRVRAAQAKYVGADPATSSYFMDLPGQIRRLQTELFSAAANRPRSEFDDVIGRVLSR